MQLFSVLAARNCWNVLVVTERLVNDCSNFLLPLCLFFFSDNDMAGRHRSRNQSIQIIKTATVASKDCKRVSTLQMHNSKLRFPLPHRIVRPSSKQVRSLYSAERPTTHFQ